MSFTFRNRMPRWKRDKARELRRNPTETYLALWEMLRRDGAKSGLRLRWHRQIPMFGYIVDFWCPSQKLIVEVNESDTPSSARRDAVFASHGVRILHFSEGDIWTRLPGVIEIIRQATIGAAR